MLKSRIWTLLQQPTAADALIRAVQKAWDSIPMKSINKVNNLKKRIKDILDADGGPTTN
jgi:hypothetical protein